MKYPSWPAEDHPRFAARVLAGGAIGSLFTPGALLFHSAGVFMPPIAEDTGWDRNVIASAIGFTSLILGLMSPVTGWLVDRFKPRRVAMVAMPAIGLGLILLGVLPSNEATYVAVMALAAVLAAGQMPHAYTLSVASWFSRRRGLALGTVLAFTGISLALVAPIAAALIAHVGWRMAYVIIGAFVGITGFVAAAVLVADLPESQAQNTSGEEPATSRSKEGLTTTAALKTPSFWLMLASFALMAASIAATTIHLPTILAGRGISPTVAASALSVIGISAIFARVAFGYFLDRVFAPALFALLAVILAVGHLMFVFDHVVASVAGGVMLGLAWGAEVDAMAYLAARAFGFRSFGRIFGLFFMGIGLGSAAGAALMGRVAAWLGSYESALIVAAGAAGLSALLMYLIRPKDLPFKEETVTPSPDAPNPAS